MSSSPASDIPPVPVNARQPPKGDPRASRMRSSSSTRAGIVYLNFMPSMEWSCAWKRAPVRAASYGANQSSPTCADAGSGSSSLVEFKCSALSLFR